MFALDPVADKFTHGDNGLYVINSDPWPWTGHARPRRRLGDVGFPVGGSSPPTVPAFRWGPRTSRATGDLEEVALHERRAVLPGEVPALPDPDPIRSAGQVLMKDLRDEHVVVLVDHGR